MTRQRKCRDCKKELTGKYYLISGIPFNGYEASRANYCVLCCEKKKEFIKDRYLERGLAKITEKEAGDKTEDEISEFEDKWEKHYKLGIKKNFSDNQALLNSIQKARQELEPYLQKLDIVEQAWERKYGDCGIPMSFPYLFTKSAKDKEYRQKVVQPTVEEILGGKLDEEISTNFNGRIPGFSHGRADGDLKINNKVVSQYWWIYDEEDDYHCLEIIFWENNKLALEAFSRALKIKEKELQGYNSPNKPERNNPQSPTKNLLSSNPTNWTLIISLSIIGVILLVGLIIFLRRKKKNQIK